MAYRKLEMLDAGELDQRVTLQSPAFNPGGDEITSYADIATVWAKVEAKQGKESDIAQRETAIQFRSVWIRYRSDVDATKRIVHRGASYDVDNVINHYSSNLAIEFVCRVIQ